MKLAIVHYHLNRGGVTRVIENQLLSLDGNLTDDERLPVLLLYGGNAAGWPTDFADRLTHIRLTLQPLPELAYSDETQTGRNLLAEALQAALSAAGFSADETLLHVHNHSLGKNVELPGALCRFADEGYSLLLQVHDFAEDFRPSNYRVLRSALGEEQLSRVLYPQAAGIHYATLNRRDWKVLQQAGVPESRLHFLPNPVPDINGLPPREVAREKLQRIFGVGPEQRFLLYPVRGIRRKNVGEILLWSQLVEDSAVVGITLPPLNPDAIPFYEQWQQLAKELRLNCLFDTGGEGALTFYENLSAADAILTTSVAEGFGMVYLESWLAGCPLVGRDLPEVTADFREAGLRFDRLYRRMEIPIDWVGREAFATAFETAANQLLLAYRREDDDIHTARHVVKVKFESETIDFADLDETLQERVIRRVQQDAAARQELRERNPLVSLDNLGDVEVIAENQRQIAAEYSLAASGRRLRSLYQGVLAEERSTAEISAVDSRSILEQFLDLRRYRLIRS